ncbi:hypothetical protein RSAG8_08733, partial [Rhizoctonia solani AG-8 WAC10335]
MPEPRWALGGLYKFVFLHLEPVSTIAPAIITFLFPGSTWFYNQLVPGLPPAPDSGVDIRARMAVLQLANCYMLLGLISSFVFRAIRDSLPHNLIAQENIIKASLIALAIADVSCFVHDSIQHHNADYFTLIGDPVRTSAQTSIAILINFLAYWGHLLPCLHTWPMLLALGMRQRMETSPLPCSCF